MTGTSDSTQTTRPQYDVIVVGGGGSGLAAACAAAQQGGQVLVLEKQPQPGGTTGIAIGSFTAAGTALQQSEGIDDNAADHAEDAGKFADPEIEVRNNGELREFFLQRAAETLSWIERMGVAFVGPNPEPPNRVPRMHNVVPGAKAYIAAMQLELRRLGGQLLCDANVTGLIREAGRVAGVIARVGDQPRQFTATRGVILAAGDYANEGSLIARHKGTRFSGIEGINPFATGDGHRLVESVGGRLVNMDVTYGPELRFVPSSRQPFQQWLPVRGWPARLMAAVARRLPDSIKRKMIKRLLVTWQHPETALFDDGAVLVNRSGRRFVNECSWPEREIAVASQPEKSAYLLLDGRLVERYSTWPHFISTAPDIAYAYVEDYQRLRPDVTVRADTVPSLATQRQIDPEELSATIARFNAYVAGRHPDDFGRQGDSLPLKRGPWVLLGPVKAYFTTTEGGAVIDRQLRVLDADNQPIAGLYAVGQNGLGGMVLFGHGLHIAWALTSGRLAGREVMGK